ncbi:21333_t:CDS:2, partial [Dentiscutata erythropus]
MSSLNDNGFVKHFEFKEFTELKEIGKGASGFVIKGNYKKGGQIVALKCVQHRNRKSSLIEKEIGSFEELSFDKKYYNFCGWI